MLLMQWTANEVKKYAEPAYAERRCKLWLPTFKLCRTHNDLIMCYIIVFVIVKLKTGDFFYL